ncbi:MAG: acyltransferase [Eubacteriales bacterium]
MKLLKFTKSILIALFLKLRYFKACNIPWINSLKGSVDISIGKGGHLSIKRYLITNGELHIRVSDNGNIAIGENVFFNHNCALTAKNAITIGDNVTIANNVVMVDHDHRFDSTGVIDGYTVAPVCINDNVWIGANSVILKGITIGEGSIIAAGSVVNKSVPAHELWGGVPAKCIKKL